MSTVGEAQRLPREAAGLRAASVSAVTGAQMASRFPPRAVVSSWPDTETGTSQVVSRLLAPPSALEHPASQQNRRLGVLAVVNWLQAQPGDSWQGR